MTRYEFTYQDMVDKINSNEMFSFCKIGDGEANCIYRDVKRNMNSDLHTYFPDLGDALLDVIKSAPSYYLGLQNLAYRQRKETFEKLTEDYGVKWCHADILHKQSEKQGIDDFIEALKKRDVIFVAPKHIRKLGFGRFIEIPIKNAWEIKDWIINEIEQYLEPDKVVVFCAGMMTTVLVNHFNGKCTNIHVGSVFDPYCGVNSRGYHFELEGMQANKPSEYYKRKGK